MATNRKRDRSAGTDIQSITVHQDGYAWEAVIRMRYTTYVARYVAGRLRVELAPGVKSYRWRNRHAAIVREFAQEKILQLPTAWHRRHEALHGIREERNAIRRAVRLHRAGNGECASQASRGERSRGGASCSPR